MTDTKEALLDSAEKLFAERGIDGTSLRAITQDAGANLAAVNYHFKSKAGLVQAVFRRRLRPLNSRRLDLLDLALEEENSVLRLERILRAFVGPVVEMRFNNRPGNAAFVQLMGRTFAESTVRPRKELLSEFSDVLARFTDALSSTAPELSEDDLAWRFHFTVGAMAYTVALGRPISEMMQGRELDHSGEIEQITERLVAFFVAAWTSPSTDSKGAIS